MTARLLRSAAAPAQGEIWWAEVRDKRRLVLIVTRSDAVVVLEWITVAPVTRTIRHIPTEIRLGPPHGLPDECVASLVHGAWRRHGRAVPCQQRDRRP